MKVALVLGTVRTERLGIRAAIFLQKKLQQRGHEVSFIDPVEANLPFLDKRYSDYAAGTAPQNIEKIAAIFRDADAFVLVSAEYNHTIPPALSNIIDHFFAEFAYKPSAIACYSNGSFGGARVALHLENMLSSLFAPCVAQLSIPQIDKAFDAQGNALDAAYDKRADRFIGELEWYSNALALARKNGLPKK